MNRYDTGSTSMGKVSFATILLCIMVTFANAESLVFPPYLHTFGIRKATPKHVFMFLGPRTTFNSPEGLATTRLDSWDDPTSKKDDDEVVVYGVNSGRHQIIYNLSMYALGIYGEKGSGKNQFLSPKGIAANRQGFVFVADSGNDRIVKLFNAKSSLGWVMAFSGKTGTDAGLKGPSRVAIDEKMNVYATDPGHYRIMVFDSTGSFKFQIPLPGASFQFSEGPTAIAIADGSNKWSYYDRERFIFCADKGGTRLWKFDFSGTPVGTVLMPLGYGASYGAVDYYHNYWVTDRKNHCVLKFDHNLTLLDVFGSFGDGDNQFFEPRGITVYKRFGQVFIAEKKGAQYFWIGVDKKKTSLKRSSEGGYTLSYKITEPCYLSVFSIVGQDTITYIRKRWSIKSQDTIGITGKNNTLIRENGLMLKIEPTYSSYTFSSWVYPLVVEDKKQ